ncbi:hypothetical protein QE381_001892 [Microbacterium sp. SORGH_AS 888]|nr:hypothetical protein [Microbacterium sp. SORGH_AS_0888]
MHHIRISPARVVVAAVAVAVISALTLAPRAIVHPLRGLVEDIVWPALVRLPGEPDQIMNTALFIPLGVAMAFVLPRRAWLVGILAALVLSTGVELAQEGIPGRVPDLSDVLWNTCGGAIGVVLTVVARAIWASARKPDRHPQPAAGARDDGERAAVRPHDGGDDGQPQTRSGARAAATGAPGAAHERLGQRRGDRG